MKPSIYVLTSFKKGKEFLDKRFLKKENNYIFYLSIDKSIPNILKNEKCLLEYDIDPLLHEAGRRHFAEWSFLLAEAKHGFCQYPFFMISSRFYEKNLWLLNDLDFYWKDLFELLKKYDFGYLPSYDRPLRWISYASWKKKIKRKEWKFRFFPFTLDTSNLIKEVFDLHLSNDVRHSSDLYCNYIGFNNRESLLKYVNFYLPLINRFFDHKYEQKIDLKKYVRSTGLFLNEKPFTFILEAISHLYFFLNDKKFFALHYDGFHEIDEKNKKMKKLKKFPLPLNLRLQRYMEWQKVKLHTESYWPILKYNIKRTINNYLKI